MNLGKHVFLNVHDTETVMKVVEEAFKWATIEAMPKDMNHDLKVVVAHELWVQYEAEGWKDAASDQVLAGHSGSAPRS